MLIFLQICVLRISALPISDTAMQWSRWWLVLRSGGGEYQRYHTGAFYIRFNSFSYDLARPSDRGGQIFKTPYFP